MFDVNLCRLFNNENFSAGSADERIEQGYSTHMSNLLDGFEEPLRAAHETIHDTQEYVQKSAFKRETPTFNSSSRLFQIPVPSTAHSSLSYGI